MTWTALVVTVAPELAESVGSFLIDQGSPGLMTEEAGGLTRVTAHFPGAAPLAALTQFADDLREIFTEAAPIRFETHSVPEADWAENWKEHFPPLLVGERLFVHPPWVAEIPAERIAILIDPGMAFGTGHHQTTRGCLQLLERADPSSPPARVCDLGTGSGILAIAAAKLGAAEVWAVDIDPEACRVAAENVAVNRVGDVIHIRPTLDDVPGTFAVVLANLLGPLLVELAPQIVLRLAGGGRLISAGLRAEEEESVQRAFVAHGLSLAERREDDGWVTMMHRRA